MTQQNNDNDRIRDFARIKEEAEQRLLRRVDVADRLARAVYWILGLVIVGTIAGTTAWVSLTLHVESNTKAIRLLWEKVYGYPLP